MAGWSGKWRAARSSARAMFTAALRPAAVTLHGRVAPDALRNAYTDATSFFP